MLKDDRFRLCDNAMAEYASSLHLHAALTSTLEQVKEAVNLTEYPKDLHASITSGLIPSWPCCS